MSTSRPALTFVIGGARSGKSAYAVKLATALGCPTLFVATAEVSDPEMKTRIRRHRARRPRTWRTVEEPIEFAVRIATEVEAGSTVIVDCLTVWLGNLLQQQIEDASKPKVAETRRARRQALAELQSLSKVAGQKQVNLIVISNEVGAGLVPPYPLGRVYRDLLGEANQYMARRAERVLLLVAGIPLDVKPIARGFVRRVEQTAGDNRERDSK